MVVALISTFGLHHTPLLPHFMRHYARLGVRQFHVSLQADPQAAGGAVSAAVEDAARVLQGFGAQLEEVLRVPFDARALRSHHDRIQRRIASRCSAILWADADEFHEFGQPLAECAQLVERAVAALPGRFVDRFARRGALPALVADTPIWAQFPLGCEFSRRVLGACADKVVLAHPAALLAPGNHWLLRGQPVRLAGPVLPVHHFKWDASVTARLRERLTDAWRARCAWWTESDTAVRSIEEAGGQVPLGTLPVHDFLDDRAGEPGPYGCNTAYRSRAYWHAAWQPALRTA